MRDMAKASDRHHASATATFGATCSNAKADALDRNETLVDGSDRDREPGRHSLASLCIRSRAATCTLACIAFIWLRCRGVKMSQTTVIGWA
jgi:hypothetical protein